MGRLRSHEAFGHGTLLSALDKGHFIRLIASFRIPPVWPSGVTTPLPRRHHRFLWVVPQPCPVLRGLTRCRIRGFGDGDAIVTGPCLRSR